MGEVYEASDGESGERVALKLVRDSHPGQINSLRREIHALSRLRHPGIVRICGHGVEEGLPWYAMDLTDGTTLDQYTARISDGRGQDPQARTASLPRSPASTLAFEGEPSPGASHQEAEFRRAANGALPSVLSLIRRLCVPLRFLHGEGLVHRDLKPSNVLVREDGRPILIDFGLITRFAGGRPQEEPEVIEGFEGTVYYAAPEQIRGEPVDARADLYSLGCILYELISGRPPFGSDDPRLVLWQHISKMPSSLSSRVDDVPPALDDLVGRLLAKDPADRIGYADDVARILQELGEQEEQEAAPRPRTYIYRSRLSGRDRELALIESWLDRLMQGRGSMLLVEGAEGIGKSRLAMEAGLRASRRGVRVIAGSCRGEIPFRGLKGALRTLADSCRDRGRDETERILGPRGPVLAAYEPALRDLPGQAEQGDPVPLPGHPGVLRANAYLLESLEQMAQGSSILLLIENLEASDELTTAFLEHFLRVAGDRPVPLSVMGTMRSGNDSLTPEVREHPAVLLQELLPLGAQAVGQLVGSALATEVSPSLATSLHEQTAGNPLLIEGYLRTAADAGLLHRSRSGDWSLPEPGATPATKTLPESLAAMTLAHMGTLSPDARHLARVVAVVGPDNRASLAAAVADLSDPSFLEALQELVRRGLLREEGDRLAFEQLPVREAIYRSLTAEERRDLHRRAAGFLTEGSESGEASWGLLAQHLLDADADPGKARECFLEAARQELSRNAHREAERHYRTFLTLADDDEVAATARTELARGALQPQGKLDEAEALLRDVIQNAENRSWDEVEAQALFKLATLRGIKGWHDDKAQLLERAIEKTSDVDLQLSSLDQLAQANRARGRLDEARQQLQQVIDRTGAGHPARASAWAALAGVSFTKGNLVESRRLCETAIREARRAGNAWTEGTSIANLATIARDEGNHRETCDLLEQSLQVLKATGDLAVLAQVQANVASSLAFVHRLEEALQASRAARRIAREAGLDALEARAMSQETEDNYLLGRVEAAWELLPQALERSRAPREPRQEAFLLVLEADMHRMVGDLNQVPDSLGKARAVIDEVGDPRLLSQYLKAKGRLALSQGHSAEAELHELERLDADNSGNAMIERDLRQLREAEERLQTGAPLVRGELPGDVTTELLAWMQEHGRNPAGQAPLSPRAPAPPPDE